MMRIAGKCPMCGGPTEFDYEQGTSCAKCGFGNGFWGWNRLCRLVRDGQLKREMDREARYVQSLGTKAAVPNSYGSIRARAAANLQFKRRSKRRAKR